jgi:hypothetical protein
MVVPFQDGDCLAELLVCYRVISSVLWLWQGSFCQGILAIDQVKDLGQGNYITAHYLVWMVTAKAQVDYQFHCDNK